MSGGERQRAPLRTQLAAALCPQRRRHCRNPNEHAPACLAVGSAASLVIANSMTHLPRFFSELFSADR